jgi:hypothetical protein
VNERAEVQTFQHMLERLARNRFKLIKGKKKSWPSFRDRRDAESHLAGGAAAFERGRRGKRQERPKADPTFTILAKVTTVKVG